MRNAKYRRASEVDEEIIWYNNDMKKIIWLIVILVFAGIVVWLILTPARVKVSKYDGFATCIKDSETIFYGAFWCSHCQAQKKLFGTAEKFLPYVECSTPDGSGQLQVCKDAGVNSYPTWVFKNGVTKTGELSFDELSKETACILPQ